MAVASAISGGARGRRQGAGGAARGYTLVELLAVIGILGILASMSIAVIAALPQRYAHEQAERQLKSLLRRARAAALETRAAATLTIEDGTLSVRAWQQLLLLRFEDALVVDPLAALDGGVPAPLGPVDGVTSGARGDTAQMVQVVPDLGRTGGALYFEVPGAYVDCGNQPKLSPPDGFRFAVWVSPARPDELGLDEREPPPGGAATDMRMFQIAAKGDEWLLWMAEDYGLVAEVRGVGRTPRAIRETRAGVLAPGRWSEVVLAFDGETLQIIVDGLPRELLPALGEEGVPTRVTPSAAPLLLSSADPRLSFAGGLDEVRLEGLAPEVTYELPAGTILEGPTRVRFDRRGELDPRLHEGAVRFTLRPRDPEAGTGADDGVREVILERSGMVR